MHQKKLSRENIQTLKRLWISSRDRACSYSKSIENEDLADQELSIQGEIIEQVWMIKSRSFSDILEKLQLWIIVNSKSADSHSSEFSENMLVYTAANELKRRLETGEWGESFEFYTRDLDCRKSS